MKIRNIQHIIKHLLFAYCAIIGVCACQDDALLNYDEYLHDSDALLFNAYIGTPGVDTRAAGNSEDLEPIVLEGGDAPLYLHRYVCDNSFDPATMDIEPATRGAQVNWMADLISLYNNFGVEAEYKNGNNYIGPMETVLANDSTIWKVKGNKVYWPGDNAMLSIYAWAPVELPSTLKDLKKEAGKMSFSYTAQRSEDGTTDAEAQTDLLLAMVDCNKKISESGKAKLHFTHPLSAIKFEVCDVIGGSIESISIENVLSEGKCEYQLIANTDGDYTNSEKGGYKWTDQKTAANFTQLFGVKIDGKTEIPQGEDKDHGHESITAKKPEATFMMIPQEIPEDAVIKIVMTQTGMQNPDGSAASPDERTITLKAKLLNDEIKAWLPGKEYVYVISTSASNWEYVFEVTGSVQTINDEKPAQGTFKSDPNNIIVNATVTDGAYYNVTSYRYRRNNPSIKEIVAWNAESSIGTNTLPTKFTQYNDRIPTTLHPTEWFPGKEFNEDGKTFGGIGSKDAVKYDVRFKTQYVATDWQADWDMRAHDERQETTGNSIKVKYNNEEIEVKPIDLSMKNGGTSARNTANCYITNSGGWYKFPLYYGNAIKDGNTNSDSYYYKKGAHEEHKYSSLVNFVDYKGRAIKDLQGTPIISGAESATLVWGDAYNIIDYVDLDKSVTPNEVIFHVARQDLQQSNSVIAIRDKDGVIMWSWHIWLTEYWVNDATLELNNGVVTCEAWAENEGADATPYKPDFDVAPRNLGWCDPKNVQYLQRTGILKFKQEKSGKTHDLNVEQREKEIEYWIGNNTYYQWGRKDPMVGFLNSDSQVKYNFGPMEYELIGVHGKDIYESIQHPNQFFGAQETGSNNDWLNVGLDYYNLWNNYNRAGNYTTSSNEPKFDYNILTGAKTGTPIQEKDFAYSAVKTVYDPSPAGYVVPPVGFFSIFTKGRAYLDYANDGGNEGHNTTSINYFNGTVEFVKQMEVIDNPKRDRNFYNFKANSTRTGNDGKIILTGTGHRWYRTTGVWGLGGNFNPHYVYLWSNTCTFCTGDRSAFSLAIGQQRDAASGVSTGDIFIITTHFQGRKNMARPIRCVKEYQ